MPIRITGMNSGLDTDAIIEALTSSYSAKKDKYTKAQTKLSWKQDAWKSLNTKVYGLYTSIGNMRYSASYSMRTTTVSDPTKATITSDSGAPLGTQTLRVNRLAKGAFLTGASLDSDVTENTTLKSLGYTGSDGAIDITVGGEAKRVVLKSSSTIKDFVGELKNAGLNAAFDENTHRIFVNSKGTGTASDFSIEGVNSAGTSMISRMGLLTSEANTAARPTDLIKYTTREGEQVLDATATRNEIITKASELVTKQKEADDYYATNNISDKEKTYKNSTTAHDTAQKEYDTAKKAYDEAAAAYENRAEDLGEEEVQALLDAKDAAKTVMDEKLSAKNTAKTAMDAAKTAYDTVNDVYKEKVSLLNTDSSYKFLKGIGINYKAYLGEDGNIIKDAAGKITIEAAKLTSIEAAIEDLVKNNNYANKVNGEDGEIELNGTVFTGSSNSYSINGLSIQASAVSDVMTVTTNVDSQGLYDKVKNFLEEYNSVINEMMKLYNADSAKDYEPLTDDEKAEMSETEIEKWEAKIKASLLRRDGNLNSVISAMTTAMMGTHKVTYNGKQETWSLATLGIHTLGTLNAAKNENYAYHIDGDAEDLKTSGGKEELMKRISEDPDAVINFMQQLATDVYDKLGEKMKSTSVRSIYTIYNDKEMASEYSNYTDLIKKWTTRAKDLEDSYYKKFSKMESALAKLQSSTSSMSSLFGQNN